MKTNKEYQASQILKKKILIKFLWLDRINAIAKWTMMALLFALALYFVLINTGACLSSKDYDQVNFAKSAFYWPLVVVLVFIAGVFIESVFSWEAKKRQHMGYHSPGFANIDFMIKRTKIRVIVQACTIVIAAILFGVWFHIINEVYPNAGRIFFDSSLGDNLSVGVHSSPELRAVASLFIAITVVLLVVGIAYIVATTVLLFKVKTDILLFKEIKDSVINTMSAE